MSEWAAARVGITRFVVAVESEARRPRLVAELDLVRGRASGDPIGDLHAVLDLAP